jgi:hypothetical protein
MSTDKRKTKFLRIGTEVLVKDDHQSSQRLSKSIHPFLGIP